MKTLNPVNKNLIALTAALGLFPVVLDTTIVNVAIIPVTKALNTDLNTVQWISVAYLLANAVTVAISGYLSTRFGTKKLFALGIAVFTLFSLLCGLAPNIEWLIAFRFLQGLGGGALMSLGIAIALEPFPKEERIKAAVIVGVPLMTGPVFGPILGGLIIDNLNWQSIFFVNVPIGLLGLYLTWRMIPRDKVIIKDGKAGFDYAGLVLSASAILAITYGFKLVSQYDPATKTALNPNGAMYGWGYWQVWVFLGAGVVFLGLFALQSLRFSRDPVVDLRLFKNYDYLISSIVTWLSVTMAFGVMFLIPSFLQSIHLPNLSAVDTGLALLPMGIATLAGMIISRKAYSTLGARWLVVIGAAMMMVSFWQLSHLEPTVSTGDLWPWMVLVGMSVTLTALPVQTLAVETLNGAALNKGTSLYQSTKSIFGAIGPTILVMIMVQQTTEHGNQLREAFMQSLPAGTIPNLNDPRIMAARQQLAAQAGTSGLNDIFNILIYLSAVLMVVALALPSKKKAAITEAETEAEPELVAM